MTEVSVKKTPTKKMASFFAALFFFLPFLQLLLFFGYLNIVLDEKRRFFEILTQLEVKHVLPMLLLWCCSFLFQNPDRSSWEKGFLSALFFIVIQVLLVVFTNPFEETLLGVVFYLIQIFTVVSCLFALWFLEKPWLNAFLKSLLLRNQKNGVAMIELPISVMSYTAWFGKTTELSLIHVKLSMTAPFSPLLLKSPDVKLIFSDFPEHQFQATVEECQGMMLQLKFTKVPKPQVQLLRQLIKQNPEFIKTVPRS